jgi:spore coat protein CotH
MRRLNISCALNLGVILILLGCSQPTDNPPTVEIESVEIACLPVKTTYLLGEIPNFDGLVVKIVSVNGTQTETVNYTTQWDTFTAGPRPVVVTVENKSASFDITVADTLVDTGLPVIYINTENAAPITSKENYLAAGIQIVDGNNQANNLEPTTTQIRGRGNNSWGQPKKPYRLKFDKKAALFGYEKAKSWVLLANYLDPTLMMNTVAFELGNRFGLPYTNHYTHVELVLNGTYQGSYVLTEQVQVGKGRVDIDEDDGFLVELDVYYDEDPKFMSDSINLPVMIKSPEDLIDPSGYDFVKTAINELVNALYDEAFPGSGYRDLIDMDTFVDFMMVNEIVRNGELGHPKSTYMYKDASGLISMGPLWDFDWAFGYTGSDHVYFTNPATRLFGQGYTGNAIGLQFFWRFFDDPNFCTKYKERWITHYGDICSVPAFIDTIAASLEESQRLNSRRWYAVNYEQEITNMKTWYNQRVAYLNGQINE